MKTSKHRLLPDRQYSMLEGAAAPPPRITIVAPTPPPYAGPELTTQHLIQSSLRDHFELIHVRSNIKASNAQKGAFSFAALLRQMLVYWGIVKARRAGSRLMYVLLAVNSLGFLKDAGSIWLGRLLGKRVVAHMKGDTLPAFYASRSSPWKWLIRITIRRLDAIIVQGAAIQDGIVATLGMSRDQLPIVPNMVETTHYCTAERSGNQILFIGHLSVGKGFVDLLRAFGQVRDRYPYATLICAGEPKRFAQDYQARLLRIDPPPDAEGKIAETMRGETPGVTYLGLVSGEAKERLFCSTDILVLPSYSESFPMAILEAMSHGCAVVASGVGAIPEILTNGVDGVVVDAGDPRSLAQVLSWLLDDPIQARRLGAAARETVAGRFSPELVVPQYRMVFAALLAKQDHQKSRS